MKIIIIAADVPFEQAVAPEVAVPEAQVQQAPVAPAPKQLSTQQPAPAPVEAPAPSKLEKKKQYYGDIDKLHAAFLEEMKNGVPIEGGSKTDIPLTHRAAEIAEQVLSMPAPNGDTIIDWAGKVYYKMKKSKNPGLNIQDARDAAYELVLEALRYAKLGTITKYIQEQTKWDQLSSGIGTSKKTDKRFKGLNEYLNWITHPEMQDNPATKGRIDEDIMDRIGSVDKDGQKFTPAHAAEEQRKRDTYMDQPVANDPHNRRRLEFALDGFSDFFSQTFASEKQQLEAELAQKPVQQRQQLANKSFSIASRWTLASIDPPVLEPKMHNTPTLNERMKELKGAGADMSHFGPRAADESPNPYWLSADMLAQTSPEVLGELWSKVTGRPAEETISEEPLGQYEDSRLRTHPLRKIEDSPNHVLENIFDSILDNKEVKPRDRQTIKDRLDLILPYKVDPTGQSQKNPAFKKAMEYVINQLYGPDSKPLFNNRMLDDNTKHVLQLIGQDFANKFSRADALDTRFKNTELEEAIKERLPDMGFRHVDKGLIQYIDPDETEQMQSIAMGEMMSDILNFIRDNKHYQELLNISGSHKAVAELKRVIRTASFLALSKLILRR